MIRQRKEKGITLTALIITVIIMLIIAGVVVWQGVSEEGIINKILFGTNKYNEAQAREELEINLQEYRIEKKTNEDETLKNFLEQKGYKVLDQGEDKYKVSKDKYYFVIDAELKTEEDEENNKLTFKDEEKIIKIVKANYEDNIEEQLPTSEEIGKREYEITFDTNGGNQCENKKASYIFDGWFLSDGTEIEYTKMPVKNETLYAHWKSQSIELPSATREGYTFKGWYLSEDNDNGSGELIGLAGDSYTPQENITVYAKWEANEYTITYEYNEATGENSVTDKNVTYDDIYGELPTPIKTGYTFAGWYKDSIFNTPVNSNTKVNTAQNHTIYAKWAPNQLIFTAQSKSATFTETNLQTVSITGASNGTGTYTYAEKSEKNSLGMDTNYISISGTTITLAASTPAGIYTYVVTASDSNSKVTKDATITITVGKTDMETPTVSIDTDGKVTWGNITGATGYEISFNNSTWTSATSGSQIIDTSSTGNKIAYVRAVSNTGNYNTPSSVGSKTVTVYSLGLNKGTGIDTVTGAGNYVSGKVVMISATASTGYIWNKWEIINGNTPSEVSTAGTTVTITQNTVLQATSTANTYKVTYNYNNATGGNSTANKNVTYASTYGDLPEPTKTGYKFEGWYKESSFTNKVTSSTKVETASDHTIYAKWTANELTYSAQSKSATFKTSSQTITITGASNGTGTYTYAEKTEKNSSGTDTNYISISGTTITLAESTPTGIYTYVVTASDSNSKVTKDATITITVGKTDMETPSVSIDTDGKITWGNITGATSYEISFDNSTWQAATSGSKAIDTNSTGNKTVYVRAVSDTENYNTPSSVGSKTVAVYSLGLNKGTGIDTVTGAGNYVSGKVITLGATAVAGYTWSKWTVTSGNTPAAVTTAATTITITQNTVLQATSTANTYKVTYNYNNATGGNSTASKNVTYASTYGDLPTPTRTSYIFGGWYKESSLTTSVTSSTKVETASDHTIYAKWTECTSHTYTKTSTSSVCQTCTKCGYQYTSHDWSNGTCTYKKCTTCGYETGTSTHSYTATSTASVCRTCSNCGTTITSHNMVAGTCTYKKCSNCSYSTGTSAHSYTATSTASVCRTCSNCGNQITTHNMVAGACTYKKCSNCSYSTGQGHSYTGALVNGASVSSLDNNYHYNKCARFSTCGSYGNKKAHSHSKYTYTNTGSNHIKHSTCSCGKIISSTTGGHSCRTCGASYNGSNFSHGTHKCACGITWTK